MKKYSLYSINNLNNVESLEPPFHATVSVGLMVAGSYTAIGLDITDKNFLNKSLNEIGDIAYQQYLENIRRQLEE
ncbi:TPA: hypothetical protein ACS72N_000663 [Providencia alcalifaciens]|jgi:hypothetical protein